MAKKLTVTDDDIETLIDEIRQELKKSKSGKISIQKDIHREDDRKAFVLFSPIAWVKLITLVKSFDTEVQWHGTVTRESESRFVIKDVLVPPHTVTGATVTSDQEKYTEWINGLDDETFNSLRFHGHSHVNMGCTPSVTDMKYREDLVSVLSPRDDNSFYIFLIFNKKGEWTGEIYDIVNDTLYETKDIIIDVDMGDELLMSTFLVNARKSVKKEVPATPASYNYTSYPAYPKTKQYYYPASDPYSKRGVSSLEDDIWGE